MPAAVEIGPAREDELAVIGALTVAAYSAGGAVSDRYATHLADAATRARHATLLAARDPDAPPPAHIVGTATFTVAPGPLAEVGTDGEGELRMLAVAPAARGRGVAAQLVEATLRLARDAGCPRMVLCTSRDNLVAQRLYLRHGFSRRPDLDWVPEPGVHLLGYARDLA